jgi:hypothetical protein
MHACDGGRELRTQVFCNDHNQQPRAFSYSTKLTEEDFGDSTIIVVAAGDSVPIALVFSRQPLLRNVALCGFPTAPNPFVAIGCKVKGCQSEQLNQSIVVDIVDDSIRRKRIGNPSSGSVLWDRCVGKNRFELFGPFGPILNSYQQQNFGKAFGGK